MLRRMFYVWDRAARHHPAGVREPKLQQAVKPSIEERVLAGRLVTMIDQQPGAILAHVANSVLLALFLEQAWLELWVVAWVTALLLVSALRGAVWQRYRHGVSHMSDAKTAGRTLTAIALISGALWGLPGLMEFAAYPLALQGFIIFVLAGMSAGAVATLSAHLPAFYGFIIPALLPLIGRLLLHNEPLYGAMGLMGAVYLVVLATTGVNLNRSLTQSLRLQMEKTDLVEDLMEARAKAEAANVAKSAFLATISHELRTPLNAVLGFAQVLENEIHGPLGHGKYREYLRHMSGSGIHLLNLIDELLELSRAENGSLNLKEEKVVDLAVELTHCVALLKVRAEHRGARLELRLPQDLPRLRADPQRLRQIVLNVVSNAIKFTPEGGLVELAAMRDAPSALLLTVRDTGIGMSERDLAVAMEFFGRVDSARARVTDGVGIGLPLTAILMKLHGGDLEIDSRPGGGTVVGLRFPPERVIENGAAEGRIVVPARPGNRSPSGPAA